jgi:hypothetical protein
MNAVQNRNFPLGVYRHYKGGRYRVHAVANMEVSHEAVVVYESLQASGEFPQGTFWVRPLREFTEHLDAEGEKISRFTYEGQYNLL